MGEVMNEELSRRLQKEGWSFFKRGFLTVGLIWACAAVLSALISVGVITFVVWLVLKLLRSFGVI